MLAFVCTPMLRAQGAPATQDELIQKLLKRIEDLEGSQKLMQEKIDKLGTTAPTPPSETVMPPAEPEPVAQPEPSPMHVLGPVEFRGFSDIDYGRAWFEKQPPGGLKGSPRSFNIGDFDLFTNTRLSDSWSMLGEMLISSDFSNEFGIEIDRLLLTYKKNDYFKISAGKF